MSVDVRSGIMVGSLIKPLKHDLLEYRNAGKIEWAEKIGKDNDLNVDYYFYEFNKKYIAFLLKDKDLNVDINDYQSFIKKIPLRFNSKKIKDALEPVGKWSERSFGLWFYSYCSY